MQVFITGATAGIGAASAKLLASQGYEVIIHGRSEAKCAPIIKTIKAE